MFHELWIGDAISPPLKHRLVGMLQRLGITRMVSLLKPQLVTTSNPVYVSLLKSLGIHAAPLPLFGSIPIMPMDSPPKLPPELIEAGIPQDNPDRGNWWLGVFFGALHSEWKPEPLISILRRAAGRSGRRVCLLLTGRAGSAGEAIWENLKREYGTDLVLIKFGELPAERISALLQIADFGIAASPWQLIGKSSTVATMLDHGLPVIVTRDDFQPRIAPDRPPSEDPLFHQCDDLLESKLLAGLPKRPANPRLPHIAKEFCQELRAAAGAIS
jgi:hypothetical protein